MDRDFVWGSDFLVRFYIDTVLCTSDCCTTHIFYVQSEYDASMSLLLCAPVEIFRSPCAVDIALPSVHFVRIF